MGRRAVGRGTIAVVGLATFVQLGAGCAQILGNDFEKIGAGGGGAAGPGGTGTGMGGRADMCDPPCRDNETCVDDRCLLSDGEACSSVGACASGFCTDGVCCDSLCDGTCEACAASQTTTDNGVCAPTAAGSTEAGCDICDGSGRCVSGTPLLQYRLGDMNTSSAGFSLAARGQGEVALAGTLGGNGWFFGGQVLSAPQGQADGVLVKYDRDGTQAWQRQIGGTAGLERLTDVVFEPNGDIVVSGRFSENVSVTSWGNVSLEGMGNDVFVARYSPTGDYLWHEVFSVSSQQSERDLVLAAGLDGGTYVVNQAAANATGCANVRTAEGQMAGSDALCISYLDAGGVTVATEVVPDSRVVLVAAATAPDGTLLVLARDQLTMQHHFIARYTVVGDTLTEVWSRYIRGDGNKSVQAMSVSPNTGEIAIAGTFNDTIDLPPPGAGGMPVTLASDSGTEAFWAVLDSEGYHVTSFNIESGFLDRVRIAFDPFNDDLVLALTSQGTVTLTQGGTPLDATPEGIAIGKFKSTGVHLWSRLLSNPAGADMADLVVAGNGNIFATGVIVAPAALLLSPPLAMNLTSSGQFDSFLVLFSP